MPNSRTTLIKSETPRHREAFEAYYAMGQERSHEKVATMFGVNSQSIKNWSESFGWKQRVKQRDLEVMSKISDTAVTDAVARKTQNLALLSQMKSQVVKLIKTKQIPLNSIRAIETIMKLEMELLKDSEPQIEKIKVEVVDATAPMPDFSVIAEGEKRDYEKVN